MGDVRVWNKRYPACPRDAVYVGRPSKWGNPYAIGQPHPDTDEPMTRERVIKRFRWWLTSTLAGRELLRDIRELRGKDLVCWCAPLPCHADVLLELANGKDVRDD